MRKKIFVGLIVLLLPVVLASCSSPASNGATRVRVAVAGPDYQERAIFKEVARENNIAIEFVELSQYTQPNPALRDKQVDVNLFQHLAYLANYNVNANDDLAMIGTTQITSLFLYSTEYDSIGGFPQGAEIAIPNEDINQARAINLLKTAGLIKLTDDGKMLPTPLDIDEKASKVKVIPVDALQTVIQKDSVAGFTTGGALLQQANLDPDDALLKDDPNDPAFKPYANGFVVRAEDKSNEVYHKLVELWHDPRVVGKLGEVSRGSSVAVNFTQPEIDWTLHDYEEALREKRAA